MTRTDKIAALLKELIALAQQEPRGICGAADVSVSVPFAAGHNMILGMVGRDKRKVDVFLNLDTSVRIGMGQYQMAIIMVPIDRGPPALTSPSRGNA